jgi:hypothetical protein
MPPGFSIVSGEQTDLHDELFSQTDGLCGVAGAAYSGVERSTINKAAWEDAFVRTGKGFEEALSRCHSSVSSPDRSAMPRALYLAQDEDQNGKEKEDQIHSGKAARGTIKEAVCLS